MPSNIIIECHQRAMTSKMKKRTRQRFFGKNNKNQKKGNRRNKFSVLTEDKDHTDGESVTNQKIPKPPLILVYGDTNCVEMSNNLAEILDEVQYSTRCLANNTIKINCCLPES